MPFSTNFARLFSIVAARALERRRRRVDQPHVESRLREHLGDAVAHRAGADHADALNRLTDASIMLALQAGLPVPSSARLTAAGRRMHELDATTRSTASATPLPPPRHSAAMPRFELRRFSAYSSVVSTRAPLAPIGWPSATAPPFTLTRAGIDAELAHDGDRLHRERLVDLEEVDVLQRPADLRRDLAHGFDRRHQHHLRREAARRLRRRCARAASCRARAPSSADMTTSAAAPSLTPGALPAVTLPSFLNAGFSAASASAVVSSRMASSRSTTSGVALLLRDADRQDLVREPALARRVRRLAVALGRVRVLLARATPRTSSATTSPDMPMWQFSNAHHRPSLIIESTSVPLPMRSPSRTRGRRYGRVAHRFHAAGDRDVDVAGRDPLRRQHHGLQSRAADLVDRQSRDVSREPAVERRLPRGVLAVARLDDVAHDALVDGRRIDAGARDRLAHDQRAELGGLEIFQGAEELAGGGADGGDDDAFQS